ncbi:carbohydrate-binding protein, partial [Longispora sp. NPDC051575]|uniref:carbohydrate-binding protein n=1 Tax=Longispora sp. NPDC051575 TaxID=3154943 RepID=UPI0034369CAD
VLLMNVTQVGNAKNATFDFLLNVTQTPPTTRPPTSAPPQGTWRVGATYAVGAQVTYGGARYRCRMAHTAIVGWEPPNTPILWARI